MAWSGVITDAGQALITQWMSGTHTLSIDGATIGSGSVPTADMHESTALQAEQDEAAIVRSESVTAGTKIRLQFGPTENASAYTATEIGIWARLDGGTRTLLSLHQEDGNGVAIPKKSTFPDFAFAIACVLAVSNVDTLEVTVDTTACATIGDVQDAVSELHTTITGEIEEEIAEVESKIPGIKVLEFSKTLSARQYNVEYTEDITSYIDDADNYLIIGSAQISTGGFGSNKYKNKWVPLLNENTTSGSYLSGVDLYPRLLLYNDGSSVKLNFFLYNAVDTSGTVKFRVAFLNVSGRVISV